MIGGEAGLSPHRNQAESGSIKLDQTGSNTDGPWFPAGRRKNNPDGCASQPNLKAEGDGVNHPEPHSAESRPIRLDQTRSRLVKANGPSKKSRKPKCVPAPGRKPAFGGRLGSMSGLRHHKSQWDRYCQEPYLPRAQDLGGRRLGGRSDGRRQNLPVEFQM